MTKIPVYNLILKRRIPQLEIAWEPEIDGDRCYEQPEDITELACCVFDANEQAEEHMWLICVNAKCQPTAFFEISHGTPIHSIAQHSQLFQRVLLSGAIGFFLVHNHPSGDPTPSEEDYKTTEEIAAISKLFGLSFLDHIVIGNGVPINAVSIQKSIKEKGRNK